MLRIPALVRCNTLPSPASPLGKNPFNLASCNLLGERPLIDLRLTFEIAVPDSTDLPNFDLHGAERRHSFVAPPASRVSLSPSARRVLQHVETEKNRPPGLACVPHQLIPHTHISWQPIFQGVLRKVAYFLAQTHSSGFRITWQEP
jgi:hypothetical protein